MNEKDVYEKVIEMIDRMISKKHDDMRMRKRMNYRANVDSLVHESNGLQELRTVLRRHADK